MTCDAGRRPYWEIVLPLAGLAIAFSAVFVPGQVLCSRDLGHAFWPLHNWYRDTVFSGESPLWDPYCGLGQSAIGDPVRQLAMPTTILARLLLPAVLGFNCWVALPFVVSSCGMLLFLRYHVDRTAAAFGAAILALSGPWFSTHNLPNLALSISLLPWLLWCVERLVERRSVGRFSAMAATFALQALAGEPVSLTVSAALTTAYAAFRGASWRKSLESVCTVIGAGLVGAGLAAVQLLPFAEAVGRSHRGTSASVAATNIYSLHPLSLVETVVPFLFGNFPRYGLQSGGLMQALNGGTEPYLSSLYIGPGVLLLALWGLGYGWRSLFWAGVLAVALVAAFGSNTPLYPLLQDALPVLRAFRAPAKYALFACFAASVLAAFGYARLTSQERGGRRAIAIIGATATTLGAALMVLGWVAPSVLLRLLAEVVSAVDVADLERACLWLRQSISYAVPPVVVMTGGVTAFTLLAASNHARARIAGLVLLVAIPFDVAVNNSSIAVAIDSSALAPPTWLQFVADSSRRVYVAGRLSRSHPAGDDWVVHGAPTSALPHAARDAVVTTQFASLPAAYRLREAVSEDMDGMWPREYASFVARFAERDQEARTSILKRLGVSYCLLPWPPEPEATRLVAIADYPPMALYEVSGVRPRALATSRYQVEPDLSKQIGRLMNQTSDDETTVTLATAPPVPAGEPCAPGPAWASIDEDGASRVVVRCTAPAGGAFVVLADSYDPGWRATVDGSPAEILRADGLLRAVRVASGDHEVRFEYAPRAFDAGLTVSLGVAGLLVAANGASWWRRRRTGSPDPEAIPAEAA